MKVMFRSHGVATLLWLSLVALGGQWASSAEVKSCSCKTSGVSCFYDPSCPGLGCGAENQPMCRFCGDAANQYTGCPTEAELKFMEEGGEKAMPKKGEKAEEQEKKLETQEKGKTEKEEKEEEKDEKPEEKQEKEQTEKEEKEKEKDEKPEEKQEKEKEEEKDEKGEKDEKEKDPKEEKQEEKDGKDTPEAKKPEEKKAKDVNDDSSKEKTGDSDSKVQPPEEPEAQALDSKNGKETTAEAKIAQKADEVDADDEKVSKKTEKAGGNTSAKSTCPCLHGTTPLCFYDESCPGLGCGAHGVANCRFCGDKNGTYQACPDAVAPHSAEKTDADEKASKTSDEACPCLHSKTLPCFYDESCPGLGCGAHGHKNCRFCGDKDGKFKECPGVKKPVILETRRPGSLILFPSEKDEAEEKTMANASLRLASDDACPCQHASDTPCFYDESCPGLGCGAQGKENCRFCGDKDGKYPACPDPDAKQKPGSVKPKSKQQNVAQPKSTKLEIVSDDTPCASCLHSKTLKCFYDESCPGVGCGAHGHKNCRFCGDKDGQFKACPDPNAKPKPGMSVTDAKHVSAAPPVSSAAKVTTDPEISEDVLNSAQYLDFYRCMAGSAVDTHPIEDDDVADLTGAIKYVHTEILTEHLQSPIRQTRKYGIDVVTRHRMQFKNPSTVLKTANALQGEFSQFVTFDFGKATNPAQLPMIKEQGDFVGIAPCTDLKCDVRFPCPKPYAWLSVGNWCPNLSWDKKGTKNNPSPQCLKREDGTIIKGGLCENGFNRNSFEPGPDPPTGEQGCTYKYGKATLVKLDDVVGITSEYCGKRRCKDWLDFRFNCSNRQTYQQQFLPNGQVKSVEYCVEFDIHPACEASCQAPACLELLRSGKTAYLGLPFWHGRCDPRANDRRVEIVAFALGLPGALKNHLLVEPQLLQRACPASKASSWSCVPLAALHFAGPYCTRSFNGACDRCYIPGVAGGPAETQKPWCPTDILQSATYKDSGLQITCKSKSASHHCCLYTGKCEGDSAPGSAPLTDDGLALVAARKNTDDMKQFLQRAAGANKQYQALPLDHENMHWAAYFAWEAAPLDRTLDEALAEMAIYLTSERPMVPLYTPPTTTTLAPTVTVPTKQLPASLSCAARSVSFGPIDMPGTMAMPTASIEECQQKCAKTKGCFHFSLLEVGNSCHLQGFSALAQENSLGFISGPPVCWQAKKDKGLLIDKGHDTYVSLAFACMGWGSSFSPALPNGYAILGEKDFPSEMDATLECQKRCVDHKDCKHFTVSFPIRSCILAGKDAMVTEGIQGAISGPPKCDDKSMQSYYWEALPKSEQPRWKAGPSALSALVLGLVALTVFISSVLSRRPSCSSRVVQQACYGDEGDFEHSHLLEWHQVMAAPEQLVASQAWDMELAELSELRPAE